MSNDNGRGKIAHAQTVLYQSEIHELKTKTGETQTKEALAKAVDHYLKCEHTGGK